MDKAKQPFSFVSNALPQDTFSVVSFKGEEGLSMPYRFEILLASKELDIDTAAVVQDSAVFTINHPSGELPFHGILQAFQQLQHHHGLTVYKAVLSPKLWWLTLTHHNQVFLDKTCPQILEAVLTDGGMQKGRDFEFKLQQNYPSWEYVCQYDESHFAFASRWMERYGLYYYFEQHPEGEKMVITDSAMAHEPLPRGELLRYAPASGLDAPFADEVVTRLNLQRRLMPKTVLLKDYNYLLPRVELMARAEVDQGGVGEVYVYGEHFRTVEEGELLATIRAQEIACRKLTCTLTSSVSYMRSGYTFSLEKHFMPQANASYLVVGVKHQGSQAEYLDKGLGEDDSSGLFYRNTCTAIPVSTQFRPERATPKPRFHGLMNAKVDAAGSGQYAELDDKGRYKVKLPFDLSGRDDGHASSWLRMMQPYAGTDHGMHFPLHKDTEVVLCCVGGDPDRPFIAAAAPNPEHKSQVDETTQTMCRITTSGQNRFHVEDRSGSERILMHTPTQNTYVRLGEPNDPASPHWEEDDEKVGFKMQTDKAFEVFAGSENEVIIGENSSWVGGFREKLVEVLATEINLLGYITWKDPFCKAWSPIMDYLHAKVQKAVGVNEKLTESQLEIAEQVLKMRQMEQKLTEQKDKLTQTSTDLAQSKLDLADDKELLAQEKTELSEFKDIVEQSNTRLEEESTQLQQTKTSLTTTRTNLKQTASGLKQERTIMAETIDYLEQNQTALTSIKTSVSESYDALFDTAIKV